MTLRPNDELEWDAEAMACVSKTFNHDFRHGRVVVSGSPPPGGVHAVTYGTSGEALPRQCCRFTSLIKAEWWHHYRHGRAPPSLGKGDSWVRLGRWERNKNSSSAARRHGLRGGGSGRGGGHRGLLGGAAGPRRSRRAGTLSSPVRS